MKSIRYRKVVQHVTRMTFRPLRTFGEAQDQLFLTNRELNENNLFRVPKLYASLSVLQAAKLKITPATWIVTKTTHQSYLDTPCPRRNRMELGAEDFTS